MAGRILRVVLSTLVVVALGVGLAFLRVDRTKGSVDVGDCVRQPGPDEMKEVSCSSEQAFAKVIEKYEGVDLFSPSECPAETDTFGRFGLSATVCLRNLQPPHLGDAGRGGGVFRAQDCIDNPVFTVNEVKCDSEDAHARLAAVVDTIDKCPQDAVQFAEVGSAPRQVLCLAPGFDVPGVGTCFSDPSLPFGGQAIDCGSPAARARVVARVDEQAQCPPGSSSVVKDEAGLPSRDTLCLAAM